MRVRLHVHQKRQLASGSMDRRTCNIAGCRHQHHPVLYQTQCFLTPGYDSKHPTSRKCGSVQQEFAGLPSCRLQLGTALYRVAFIQVRPLHICQLSMPAIKIELCAADDTETRALYPPTSEQYSQPAKQLKIQSAIYSRLHTRII